MFACACKLALRQPNHSDFSLAQSPAALTATMERNSDKSDRLRSPSIRNKAGTPRGRRDPVGATPGVRSQIGRSHDGEFSSMKFTELEGLDSGAVDGSGLTSTKMMDSNFFNCFGDPFNESDMKPNQASNLSRLNQTSHQQQKQPQLQ